MTIGEMRLDFITRRKGSLALPITGLTVYSFAALLSLLSEPRWHNLVLTLCFWMIMPVGALVMRLRGEESGSPQANALFDLSFKARWMALSTRAIHVMVWMYAPALFPVSVGIGFALHWVIFSWTVGHPVGFVHLAMRIIFVIAAWHLVPGNRMGAVAAGVALAYGLSLLQLSGIDWQARLGAPDPEASRG